MQVSERMERFRHRDPKESFFVSHILLTPF